MIKTQFTAVTLERHIKLKHGGKKSAFAESVGVKPQAVTKWINAKWIVADGRLYSPMREHEALK
jgi:DNA-binding transcriptional regulator YdaS (Cro superfamily)